ncbi:hypothetical protein Acr_00g0020250 [Actinidia rufa]|uniref:Uncharacterized protein n=1 Tax=Actinidia rufa TaxID=165716 RepID=A0A7J0DDR7_9ERIC|nr:hypothetical protein Acr_00g0020250 [Actinidia rufa]
MQVAGGLSCKRVQKKVGLCSKLLTRNSIQRASTARNGPGTQATVKSNGVFEVRQSPDLSQKVEKLTQTLENIFCTGSSSTTRPTIGEVCALCLSPAHPMTDCHLAPHYPEFVQEHVNAAQGYSRPVNDPFSNTYNPGWRKQPDQGNFAQGPKPNFPIGQMPLAYRPNIPPGYQQPPPPPPQRNTDFKEKVLQALQSFEVTNQTTSQLLSSHTQSIAKLETQMGQLANVLSRRDEGKLPSQSVANPKGQYEVHDIHGHEQAKAIMTLRAGREIDTRSEEEKKDKKEEEKSSNNSKVVVSESPSPKGDVSLPPTCAKELPTAPRVLRAPFPACLTSPSSFDKKASQYPPIEEADCCAITMMMDELVEEALPYILTEDPLEACLTHFGFDEYDVDHSIEDINTLLGETTPFIDRHPWMEAPFFMPEDDLFPLRLHHALIWAFNLDEYMLNPIFQDGYWIPPEEHILNILNNTSGLSYCPPHDISVVLSLPYFIVYDYYFSYIEDNVVQVGGWGDIFEENHHPGNMHSR